MPGFILRSQVDRLVRIYGLYIDVVTDTGPTTAPCLIIPKDEVIARLND
jgi:hypothetical protein